MNREFLKELGLEADAIDKIMAENGKDIEKAKGNLDEQSGKVKELEAETKSLKETISERDKQLEALKVSSGDNEDLKKQIDKLTEENKAATERHETEMKAVKKSHAIEKALTEAKAINPELVRKLIDEDKVSMDGDNLLGLSEQIDKLKEDEGSKSLFSSGKPTIKGAEPGQPSDEETPGGTEKSEMDKRIAKYK